MKYYSKSSGFFSTDIHESIPLDAVEISDEYWMSLIRDQHSGKLIVPDDSGRPISIQQDPGPRLLHLRDQALKETDWLVARHRDEVDADPGKTTLTQDQYRSLQQWRQSLRDLRNHPNFPNMRLPRRPV